MTPTKSLYLDLSRRERQIMDAVYRLERASVAEVRETMPDAPGYSAVRAMIGKLEAKGFLEHEQDGPRYLYRATTAREEARESALQRIVRTFFDGSAAAAAAAMLDMDDGLTDRDLDEFQSRIDDARRKGR